jgi:hypothetical protein
MYFGRQEEEARGGEEVPTWVKALLLLEAQWDRLESVREADRRSMVLAEEWGIVRLPVHPIVLVDRMPFLPLSSRLLGWTYSPHSPLCVREDMDC